MNTKALVIGAAGQIGIELTLKLEKELGKTNVFASDIRKIESPYLESSQTILLDVLDKEALLQAILKHEITEVYHLAATLSANAEKNPEFSWKLNMESLLSILGIAKDGHLKKIFWPSSIAVFGLDSPKNDVPQTCIMNPNTVYGISKLAGERWCEYYFEKYGVDVRSVRFPGLLGYKSEPGGGTTDYALWALKNAAENKPYVSFLSAQTSLPMMHMEDAIESIWQIMSADPQNLTVRSSYNISGCSFSPEQLEQEIRKTKKAFTLSYEPDFRQTIAESWPNSLNDSVAKNDWNWNPKYNFSDLVTSILEGFKKKELTETLEV